MGEGCAPLAGIFWFGVGALLFGFFFVMLRNKREAENLPTSTCRAVPIGLVEVCGTATGVPFTSPFAGIPSLCSTLVVEEWREGPKAAHWHEIYGESFSTPFQVEDGTGRVRVVPTEADLHLETDYAFDMKRGLQASPVATDRLRLAGLGAEGVRGRLLEFAVKGGRDAVPEATQAALHIAPRPRGDLTAQVFARGVGLARVFQDMPGLLLSRKPRLPHGVRPLRMREANLCPGDRVFVLGTATADDTTEATDRIVIGRGSAHPWFAIGETSQKETLERMLRHGWVVAAVGIGLMLAGLSMLADCAFGP